MPLQIVARQTDVASKKANRSKLWVGVLIGVALAGVAFVVIASSHAGRIARKHLVAAIEQHYHAKVELKDFTVMVFPRVVIHGEGLVLRQNQRADASPFIEVESFTTDASVLDLLRKRKRIHSVTLKGLQITIANHDRQNDDEKGSESKSKVPEFVIEEVDADGTKLTIVPKNPAKDPLIFAIEKLHLKSAGKSTSMDYQATLTNAVPPGLIHSKGKFGPFQPDDAGQTPLSGTYQFRDADLSVFQGISGTLSSDGSFNGTLGNIVVDGNTEIPNFMVRDGHPVNLKTEFHAIVDGTNGDTELDPVKVAFKNSRLVARGKVDGVPGIRGKSVALNVTAENARVEDLLMLVVKSEPPLQGNASFNTSFVLSPGKGDFLDRLQLRGRFGLSKTQFAKPTLQQKIAKLSNKAQGNHHESAGDTASNFHGNFTLQNAVAQFANLEFDVPGAKVALEGTYNLDSEKLDFHGHLQMDAKLADMTTGVKSFFARMVQPLVTKHDDTVIPIKVSGTRSDPKFGIQIGKLLTRR